MSSLSQFAPFASGGLKSYQTGYVMVVSPSFGGGGQDDKIVDVTVSSVSTSKTMCSFAGAGGSVEVLESGQAYSQNGYAFAIVAPRMTSSTNLRLATSYSLANVVCIQGRWQIAEAN
jgi:hypothetical protein